MAMLMLLSVAIIKDSIMRILLHTQTKLSHSFALSLSYSCLTEYIAAANCKMQTVMFDVDFYNERNN